MTTQTFEYCSLCYLNLWSETDKSYFEALSNNVSKEKKLAAIKTVANVYSVARNLRTRYDVDEGLERFEPILDILESVNIDNLKNTPIDEINSIRKLISTRYGGNDVLSLTTKFLWFKKRSPVLIYDSQALKALNCKSGDLKGFYKKWHTEFSFHEEEINDVCSRLEQIHPYMSISDTVITKKEIRKISSEKWFRERVFDIYLWKKG